MSDEAKAPSGAERSKALEVVPPAPLPKQRAGFTTTLLFTLVGMLLGVVVGAAGVGENVLRYFSPEARQARELTELSARIDELRADLTARERELSAERQERKQAIAALQQSLETAEWNTLAATFKGEFVARFLAYEQGKSESSRRQLVESACGLRSQAKSARMTLAMVPLDVASEELRRGPRPEMEQLLVQRGVTAEVLLRAKRDATRIVIPAVTAFNVFEVQRAAQARRMAMRDAQDAVSAIQRQAQAIKVPKAVKFADGAEYSLPPEVALAMALRKDCSGE